MAFGINNFLSNDDIHVTQKLGAFSVVEYKKDLSVTPQSAANAFFMSHMNVRRRQLLIQLNNQSVTTQAGAMQWTLGNIEQSSGVKGAKDFLGKIVKGAVSGESAVKPEYSGTGAMLLEPTYKHLILIDLDDWNNELTVEDGMFLACDYEVKHRIVRRRNVSSAVLGGEGLFNIGFEGKGIVALESDVPREELIEIELQNDTLKVDGSLAIAWSSSLDFTVEKSGKSLVGSMVGGEGLVNVFRGTGRVLLAPTQNNFSHFRPQSTTTNTPQTTNSQGSSVVGSLIGEILQ